MSRAALLLIFLLAVTSCLLLLFNGCGGSGQSQIILTQPKIQHVVVIFQENRTPDNLFHDQVLINAGADIASSGLNSKQQTVPLTPISLGVGYDLSHSHDAFLTTYDGGKMDGADLIGVNCEGNPCPPPNPEYLYVNPSDVQPYFQMAEQYTFGDRMFQTNQGPSFPAHQFIISGTSAPTATSTSFVSNNASGVPMAGENTGCTAPPAEYVSTVDASGADSSNIYPCTDHPAITDQLDTKGISWRYYTPTAGSLWTGPNAIQHVCGPNATPPNATQCIGSDWVNHVVLYTTAAPAPILTDIANGQLPTVSWVIPSSPNSDHAGSTGTTGGPSWVASIVNAIGGSPYWANTAIIVTWDDWGGWYDHVAPKLINDGTSWGSGYVYGFRVPLIVISPYAKPAYISHVNHDFGSVLKFIEDTFGLQSLGYADATADDLSDCFNFNQAPLIFKTINAPLPASHFLRDKTPPAGPDDD
ncbi:MAG TPA: alkaline phosphatase family protein [Candidatus Dormibacteraeota bacterium]|nr:alkaline phosphatase family protein [Candidatus Dormibacteraeota bacterium]